MPNHPESTQRSEKSDIKALVAALGDGMVKDINTELFKMLLQAGRDVFRKDHSQSHRNIPVDMGQSENMELRCSHTV
jgi:hypothetical protein